MDYSKELKYNQTLLDDLQHNSTSEYVWIYNDEVELLVKVNLRIIGTLLAVWRVNFDNVSMATEADKYHAAYDEIVGH
jgi:hypothetical protein